MKMWFVTSSNFPNGDAEALRVEAFCNIFMKLGYLVGVICYGDSKYNEFKEYKGIQYVSLKKKGTNKISKTFLFLSYTTRLKKFFKKIHAGENDVMMASDLRLSAIIYLKSLCKKHKLTLLYDSIEWFSPEQFSLGKYDIRYVMKDLENKYVLTSYIKIIAISEYLEKYFTSKKCKVLRIPVITAVNGILKTARKNGPIVVTYAGSPGKKDNVAIMLKGIAMLSEQDINAFEFNFVGFSIDEIRNEITESELNHIIAHCKFHGRLTRSNVIEIIASSDFTMLLRNAEFRYAQAGFPTKVIESLMLSTPIICNYSSDLVKYLKDTREIILVKSCDSYEFSLALKKALNIDSSELRLMKENALKCAKENFDYSKYITVLSEFIMS